MTGDLFGDFSKLAFAAEKHYSGVLLQQGRVSLDSDANEHSAILLRLQRLLTVDLLGPFAAPAGNGANFAIDLDTAVPAAPVLRIGGGHCYLQGLLCESDQPTSLFDQPDGYLDPHDAGEALPAAGPYLVYLQAWERQLSTVQDPSIREVALGDNGPDTTLRTKVVWRVLVTDQLAGAPVSGWPAFDAKTALDKWNVSEFAGGAPARGTLRAQAKQPQVISDDSCTLSPSARYRGMQNQLYRVEIHDADGGQVTFKWSRDNGSVVFPVDSISGTVVTLSGWGRDDSLGLSVGDWVEALDERAVVRGDRHNLLRVQEINLLDLTVVLSAAPEDGIGQRPDLRPFLRRWDQQPGPTNRGYPRLDPGTGVLDLTRAADPKSGWLQLEHGIEVQFQPGGTYRPGDFWLIPGRVATGDVEWPQRLGSPDARPPVGIDQLFAPLALVDPAGTVVNLRATFAPLAALA